MLWKVRDDWSDECRNCGSCCYYPSMQMHTDENKWPFDKGKTFWNRHFVINQFNLENFDDFNYRNKMSNAGKKGLYCPLAIPEGCLIYEDRPLLCKKLYCAMKSKKPLNNGK